MSPNSVTLILIVTFTATLSIFHLPWPSSRQSSWLRHLWKHGCLLLPLVAPHSDFLMFPRNFFGFQAWVSQPRLALETPVFWPEQGSGNKFWEIAPVLSPWGMCVCVCGCCLVAKKCPTLCDSMDCSLPGSSVHGISQARILEKVAISFLRGSSWPRDQTHISCIGRQFPYHWACREAGFIYTYIFI